MSQKDIRLKERLVKRGASGDGRVGRKSGAESGVGSASGTGIRSPHSAYGSGSGSGATFQKTKELFLQKLSIPDIAERRGLSPGTILTHLEKMIEGGQEIDISHLAPMPERLEQIRRAFKESGGWILAPVRSILGEDFFYEELRLARIFIRKITE